MSVAVIKWLTVAIFILSVLHVHLRGRVRLPFLRQLFNHSSIVAPINTLMHVFSAVPNTPYLPANALAGLDALDQHWETIRDEAVALRDMRRIKAAQNNNDAGFNSFFKSGWKRFYLKWYDARHPSAEQFCPKTVALLRKIPSIKAAMFAELPPGAKLNPHRDPFAGSLRYHLGLVTPNDDRCFIDVDGTRYSWRDGKSVVFDETYIHWAFNGTDVDRIILFCDVERPMRYRWAQALNHFVGRTMLTAASSPNEIGDQEGLISKLFYFVWVAGQYRRRLKKWNKTVYNIVRIALVGATVGFLIWI